MWQSLIGCCATKALVGAVILLILALVAIFAPLMRRMDQMAPSSQHSLPAGTPL